MTNPSDQQRLKPKSELPQKVRSAVLNGVKQGQVFLLKYWPMIVSATTAGWSAARKSWSESGKINHAQPVKGVQRLEDSTNDKSSETFMKTKKLKNISDIRRYFHRNQTPIYFISATNFNLLGISEWVQNFRYINYLDCFDGRHPNVRIPTEQPHREFSGIEDINNYLLQHKEVMDYVEHRGPGGKAVFLMFDEESEKLCKDLGLDVWFPPAALRESMDNKIETVRLGNRAGVPSVPNVLSEVKSYQESV